MRTFRQAEHERETKSYNKIDYNVFSELRNHDIDKYSKLVAEKMSSGKQLTNDEICACSGVEVYLSRDVPRRLQKIMNSRDAHVKKVLSAQKHGCNVDGIARVSMKSSRAARVRSHDLAVTLYLVCR